MGVCTSSYVFDLFLSLYHVLDLARSWCTASFVIIVVSYGVSPPLSSCGELSFTFEVSLLLDWILLWIWEHLLYVLHGIPMVTMGCSIDSLDVCFGDQLAGSAHEPMHRGWHTFSSWLSGRNFGALFEVLCVGWMNLRFCDAYRIIMPTDTWGDNGVSRWH